MELSGLSSNPTVPEDAQGPGSSAVTAFPCVLHQPSCASLLLLVPPGGEVRDTKTGSLRPPDQVGVLLLILAHFPELKGVPFKCQSSVPEERHSRDEASVI